MNGFLFKFEIYYKLNTTVCQIINIKYDVPPKLFYLFYIIELMFKRVIIILLKIFYGLFKFKS